MEPAQSLPQNLAMMVPVSYILTLIVCLFILLSIMVPVCYILTAYAAVTLLA